ncbi:acyltransferase [Nocardioides cavernae]|uniref:acyltransferase family protein n=1 Tax=Nocardioides TaxID=1839 RepID=UPI00138EE483|nr:MULTISPECIES: acyltransferase family protein [Nocardioides]MCK9822192.1 acyltransferase [Nocardioides cavernae]
MTHEKARPPLRADIQALRALAVILVVAGHAWPQYLPGGFVGVDVFFVISGYLVAGSILRTVASGERVFVLAFLARRARRILPAAAVVALLTTLIFSVILDPLESSRYVRDGLAAIFFVANFRSHSSEAGYFSVVDPSPLRHYWSLGVEEQFYLVLPVAAILILGLRIRGRAVLALVALATMLSYVGGVWLASRDPGLAFYMLPSRAWEFGAGAAVALIPTLARRTHASAVGVAGLVGVVGVAASVTMLAQDSLVPGPRLLPAVAGTALILYAGSSARPLTGRWMSPFVWLGDRSYALYLTHWPPIAWLLIREQGGTASTWATLTALVIALFIAMVLHALIERPIHRGAPRFRLTQSRRTQLALALVAVSAAVVSTVPLVVTLHSDRMSRPPSDREVLSGPLTNPGFVPSNVTPTLVEARTLNGLYQGCHGTADVVEPHPCSYGPAAAPALVVVGDSHAANWYDAFRAGFPDSRVSFLTHTACPLYDLDVEAKTPCDEWRQNALDYLLEVRPEAVVLANYSGGQASADGKSDAAGRFLAGWRSTLSVLEPLPRVIVLGDVPIAPFDPPRCLAKHIGDARNCDFVPVTWTSDWNEMERDVVTENGRPWVETTSWFCSDRCASLAGSIQIWRDAAGHLTPESSRLVAPRVREAIGGLVPALN